MDRRLGAVGCRRRGVVVSNLHGGARVIGPASAEGRRQPSVEADRSGARTSFGGRGERPFGRRPGVRSSGAERRAPAGGPAAGGPRRHSESASGPIGASARVPATRRAHRARGPGGAAHRVASPFPPVTAPRSAAERGRESATVGGPGAPLGATSPTSPTNPTSATGPAHASGGTRQDDAGRFCLHRR